MSDKFKIIDHDTFERMQQSSSKNTSTNVTKIRNSKYKRMTASNHFNLMQFMKTTRGKNLQRKGRIKKRIIDAPIAKKHKGKRRENGAKKKSSRLKKSILQYRQKRRKELQIEEQLLELENDLKIMKVDDSPENKTPIRKLHSTTFRE